MPGATTVIPLAAGQRVTCPQRLGVKTGTVVGDSDVEHLGRPHRAVRFDRERPLALVPVDWLEPIGKRH